MTPDELGDAIVVAVRDAVSAGQLAVEPPATVVVERPKNKAHGDYATNVAMQLAKQASKPPRDVAGIIAERLARAIGVSSVDIAGPGFLNIRLDDGALGEIARTVVTAGAAYGHSDTFTGLRINLEFVSANPTGPLHLGHARWAAVGDSLHRLLEATGADVVSEFYINDAGTQLQLFGESLYAASRGESVPANGYAGEYISDIASQVAPNVGQTSRDEEVVAFRDAGYRLMMREIEESLARFGVHFDVWYSERTLHESGAVEKAVDTLRQQGHVYELDGAVWLRTSDFGDDKDRVLIRSDGSPTYFAADAAYYLDKRGRGFERLVYMLGADHHGYVQRLRAIAACAGDDPSKTLDVLIGQMVNLFRGGEPVRLSKRAGNIVALDDLVEAIGVDASRYALARFSVDSPIDLDLDLWARQSDENPVFYVQYAHARISSLLRNAHELGVERGDDFKPELLNHEREGDLLRALGELPRVAATAAELREPHRVARYLEELAGIYHRFYDACRVLPVGDEEVTDLNRARLWLCEATRLALANGLALLGVSAPERM